MAEELGCFGVEHLNERKKADSAKHTWLNTTGVKVGQSREDPLLKKDKFNGVPIRLLQGEVCSEADTHRLKLNEMK